MILTNFGWNSEESELAAVRVGLQLPLQLESAGSFNDLTQALIKRSLRRSIVIPEEPSASRGRNFNIERCENHWKRYQTLLVPRHGQVYQDR